MANEYVQLTEKLIEWLPRTGKWRICWRATEHGWKASTFHQKCYGKKPSLLIVKVVKNTRNLIFGGYSTEKFDGSKFELIIVVYTNPQEQVQK